MSRTMAESGAQIQTAGTRRRKRASKNFSGVAFSALKAMTKPLMTKNTCTPTQPEPANAISGWGGMPPVARAEMPSGKAQTQKP